MWPFITHFHALFHVLSLSVFLQSMFIFSTFAKVRVECAKVSMILHEYIWLSQFFSFIQSHGFDVCLQKCSLYCLANRRYARLSPHSQTPRRIGFVYYIWMLSASFHPYSIFFSLLFFVRPLFLLRIIYYIRLGLNSIKLSRWQQSSVLNNSTNKKNQHIQMMFATVVTQPQSKHNATSAATITKE